MSCNKLKQFLITIVFLCATCSSSPGYPQSYGPFEKGESPQGVAIHECIASVADARNPDVLCFTPTNAPSALLVKLQLIKNESEDIMWQITVQDGKGTPLCKPATNDMPTRYIRVFTAHLNLDGQPDFIVDIWSGGCGLASTGSTKTFLLSDKGKYKATNFYSYDFGPEDIVRLKPDGPYYFIHNDLVGNGDEITKDGRDHNFWVFQLYKFSGGQMVEANKDDARFPKWVWYTFKNNHKETTMLDADQKKSILQKR